MRGAGAVGWDNQVVYCFFMTGAGVTHVRLSADEADRLDVVAGLRVRLALPGARPSDVLLVRVTHEPPFAWAEFAPLAAAAHMAVG